MAFIDYRSPEELPAEDHIDDNDHILQVHSVHPRVMRQHLELYRELMHRC